MTGAQWLARIGLALILPVVVELDKGTRRARQRDNGEYAPDAAVNPLRARSTVA